MDITIDFGSIIEGSNPSGEAKNFIKGKKVMKKTDKININIYEEDVYAAYGSEDAEFLDEDLVDAVRKTANAKPIKDDLAINFIIAKDKKIEKDRFVDAYKNAVINQLETKKREITRCLLTGSIMAVVAVCLLFVYVYGFAKINAFFDVVGAIIAWVFSWTAVQIFTIDLIQLLIDKAKINKLLKANIDITNKKK